MSLMFVALRVLIAIRERLFDDAAQAPRFLSGNHGGNRLSEMTARAAYRAHLVTTLPSIVSNGGFDLYVFLLCA